MMTSSLLDLPQEILQSILTFLPAEALCASQRACKLLSALASDPLLWRTHCLATYQFWHHSPPENTDWKVLYAKRQTQDALVSSRLGDVLARQNSRVPIFQDIYRLEEDAKDILLEHFHVSSDAPDFLARRFWAGEAFGSINRKIAVQTWGRLADGENVPLEQALGAWDLFIVQNPPYTLEQISQHLDRIANDIRNLHPEWSSETPRAKALLVLEALRAWNLVGVRSEETRYELQNNLISIALCEHDHPSLPLISVAIYCCVAQRLGVDARPCGFPFHVHAIVLDTPNQTLNNGDSTTEPHDLSTAMYLDPFGSDVEVSQTYLRSLLSSMGVSNPPDQQLYLGATSVSEMVCRAGRNIASIVQRTHASAELRSPDVLTTALDTFSNRPEPTYLTSERADYATTWALVLLEQPPGSLAPAIQPAWRREHLARLVNNYSDHFLETDFELLQSQLLPRCGPSQEGQALEHFLRETLVKDAALVVRRPRSATPAVRFPIGTYFRHRRYHYDGLVFGWSERCEMGPAWQAQMGVHTLPGGAEQPFYNVINDAGSLFNVAQDNVDPHARGEPLPCKELMRLAGRWFKRFDAETMRFVSNLKDEYPDD